MSIENNDNNHKRFLGKMVGKIGEGYLEIFEEELVIESPRLKLVPISEKYAEDIFREFTSIVTVYMKPQPAESIEGTIAFIQSAIKSLKDGTDIVTVIIDKESGDFIGCAGLHHTDTDTPELGIWLKVSGQGKGYGLEAMRAMKEWADQNLNYTYLLYPVADKNIASCKIPEALGGSVEKEYEDTTADGRELHILEYHIPGLKS